MINKIFKTAIIIATLIIITVQISAQGIDSFREQSGIAPSVILSSSAATSSADSFSYKRGATYEESILSATPQAVSVVRNNDAHLACSTGAAVVDIPIYTLQGREMTGRSEVEYFGGDLTKKDSICVKMEYYGRDSLLWMPSRLKSRSVWAGASENSTGKGGIFFNSGKPLRKIEYLYPEAGSVLECRHQVNTPIKTIYTIEPNRIEKIEGGTITKPFSSDSLIIGHSVGNNASLSKSNDSQDNINSSENRSCPNGEDSIVHNEDGEEYSRKCTPRTLVILLYASVLKMYFLQVM